ncbi:MAG: DUF72 domain-containing protein [Comamonadaceae bacterium]|nr:MAG: DUF72 domain-containing protein [Comamonadaceae bacterium]
MAEAVRLTGKTLIGTAGWSIPKIDDESFPKDGSHLERYAAVLPVTEINSSFYRHHRRSTYERWAASVPDHFRFSAKVPRSVTHFDWIDISAKLDAFLVEIAGLGHKLGPILIQLPPKRAFDIQEADRFLTVFRSRVDGDLALEPRHPSWFLPGVDELLQTQRISRVAADPPPAVDSDKPGGWRGLIYTRLHGSPDIYRSSYTEDRLRALANAVITDAASDAWCIFDNTASYAATRNALALETKLGRDNRK